MKISKLERLAGVVAIEAPLKPSANHVRYSKVRWDLINKIRSELDRMGIDWEKMKKATKESE